VPPGLDGGFGDGVDDTPDGDYVRTFSYRRRRNARLEETQSPPFTTSAGWYGPGGLGTLVGDWQDGFGADGDWMMGGGVGRAMPGGMRHECCF
jgi:hypothetical protein